MDRKLLLVGLSAAALIGLVALGAAFFSRTGDFRGTTYPEPYPVAGDFELTRSDGTSFRLSDMRGRIVLLYFGYTTCPDVCPTTLAELNLALTDLGTGQAGDVRVVFVTVDPARDDPVRVQEYVNHFNPDFIGLSGTEPELATVWSDYGIFRETAEGSSAAGYLVNHTARVTLIDRHGNLRVSFGFGTPMEDILHDLKLILRED
jgi:protein SCO1/2